MPLRATFFRSAGRKGDCATCRKTAFLSFPQFIGGKLAKTVENPCPVLKLGGKNAM